MIVPATDVPVALLLRSPPRAPSMWVYLPQPAARAGQHASSAQVQRALQDAWCAEQLAVSPARSTCLVKPDQCSNGLQDPLPNRCTSNPQPSSQEAKDAHLVQLVRLQEQRDAKVNGLELRCTAGVGQQEVLRLDVPVQGCRDGTR